MGESRKPRGSDLTPEQLAKVEEVRKANRTPEARARQQAAREPFKDKPTLDQLVQRGDVDPSRITTMGGVVALHKALAAVKRVREARGLSLSDAARRAEMPVPTASRLEGGKQGNFTFETLARYAAGVGLDLEIVVKERDPILPGPVPAPVADLDAELDQLTGDVERLMSRVNRLHSLRGASPAGPAPRRSRGIDFL